MKDERRLRILMIVPTAFFSDYGCSIRILEQARALKRLNNEVLVCTYGTGANPPGLPVRRVPLTPKGLKPGFSYHRTYLDLQLAGLAVWHALR